jgi:hypothetical protein
MASKAASVKYVRIGWGEGVVEMPFKAYALMLTQWVYTHVGRESRNRLFLHTYLMDAA